MNEADGKGNVTRILPDEPLTELVDRPARSIGMGISRLLPEKNKLRITTINNF
jgi:hypothetical protein